MVIVVLFTSNTCFPDALKLDSPIVLPYKATKSIDIRGLESAISIAPEIVGAEISQETLTIKGINPGRTTVFLTIAGEIVPIMVEVTGAQAIEEVQFVGGYKPFVHVPKVGSHSATIRSSSSFSEHHFYQNPSYFQGLYLNTPIGNGWSLLASSSLTFDPEILQWVTGYSSVQSPTFYATFIDYPKEFGEPSEFLQQGDTYRGSRILFKGDYLLLSKPKLENWSIGGLYGIVRPNPGIFWDSNQDSLFGLESFYENRWFTYWNNLLGFNETDPTFKGLFQSYGARVRYNDYNLIRGQFWNSGGGSYWDAEGRFNLPDFPPKLEFYSRYSSLGPGYNFIDITQPISPRHRLQLSSGIRPLKWLNLGLSYMNTFVDFLFGVPTSTKVRSNSVSPEISFLNILGTNVGLGGSVSNSEANLPNNTLTADNESYSTTFTLQPVSQNSLFKSFSHLWVISIDNVNDSITQNLQEQLNKALSITDKIDLRLYLNYFLDQTDKNNMLVSRQNTISFTFEPTYSSSFWKATASYTYSNVFGTLSSSGNAFQSLVLSLNYFKFPNNFNISSTALLTKNVPEDSNQVSGTLQMTYKRDFDNELIKDVLFVPNTGTTAVKVFQDIDQDGEFKEGEQGIPGVKIAVSNTVITTNDIGEAEAKDLPPGEYEITLDDFSLPEGTTLTSINTRTISVYRSETTAVYFGAYPLTNLQCIVYEDVNKNKEYDSLIDFGLSDILCTITNIKTREITHINTDIYGSTLSTSIPPPTYQISIDPYKLPDGFFLTDDEPKIVTLKANEPLSVKFPIEIFRKLYGQFFLDTNANRIYDDGVDPPLPNFSIKIGPSMVRSSEKGLYVLGNVGAGTIDLELGRDEAAEYSLSESSITIPYGTTNINQDIAVIKK